MQLFTDPYNAFLDHSDAAVKHAASGPLSGLRLAVKDIFDIAGHRTGCGSPQRLAEAQPASSTAPAIQKMLDAGAAFVGRTQTEELAFSLTGQNAHYPYPINPVSPNRVTGGSSSGSVAAVAAGLADIAVGSDTGGSIRAPASFCGLIGLRPTHGVISLEGVMPLAPSLDTFGWFAKDAATYEAVGRLFFEEIPSFSPRAIRLETLDALLLGPAEKAAYAEMVSKIAETIGTPVTAEPLAQGIDDLYWAFRRIQAHEAWASHGTWISSGERQLGPGVKERFEFGSTITDEQLSQASKVRAEFRKEFEAVLGQDGILVLPTVPGAAPRKDVSFDELQAYREQALRLLCISGLSGFPQITIPLGTVNDAPFGISLMGPAGSDLHLIRFAGRIMDNTARN